jgi:uncharacterized coiled-coil protein SlyX
MRKPVVIALALISLVFVGTTGAFYSKYKKSVESYAQLKSEDESTRSRYGAALTEIATIQDSLNAIVLGENGLRGVAAQSRAEVQMPPTVHDQVLERIAMLKGAIERTKDRIQMLDSRLKKNGIKIAGLEKMVAGLRSSVAEKEELIAQLSTQVDGLQTQVTGLSATVEQKTQEVTDKQHELATVFYTIGTKKELTKSGIVESKGGVLGLGKTLKPSGTLNEAAFTPLDTDQENVIRIPSEKVQVLSAQPVSSYVLAQVGKDMVELRIVDPKEFRKIKQVVILTT